MVIYMRVIGIVLTLLFVVGLAGPWLVSQPSTELVFAGLGLVIIVPPILWKLGKPIYDYLIKKIEEREENV